jgi:hypothetical protein
MRRVGFYAITGLSAASFAVAGCGSPDPGTVVAAPSARQAVMRSGFRIHWRTGPTPKPFVASLYGTAEGKHGISVNFGFLFAGNTDASGEDQPSLLALVPHATDEGSTAALSVVAISSAGSHGGSPDSARVNEEFHIANTLERKVAKLAPVAHAQEGP